ncbi:hypothetical protein FNF29_05051 [Cafeteria roenbergensis]|uniref:Autophagy-related protein 11 C-terminal domain-containing protein n=1 Tax=Cafeteria roenbergensis TaxID=33653 RepID=A0A5A8CDS8_CAFRO|nr:hypothetical protein FNF29_05051 [Cafeteria roenbergensis]|eukprot:KAA0150714.1 hypothetical protein FNF29_05051 [Cafeteria roenbergensis]
MAAETEQLEIPFVNATTGLRSTLVTERTESAESFRSKLAGEVNASAGDLIVIVGGKFKQLDSDTTPARLADETGESAELFVFTRDFVVQAQEAMDVAASPGDGGSAAASGVRASADLGPAPLGDVRAALLGDADAPLGDEAAVRELLAPVAAWFAGLDHEELSAERETWTAAVTPGADGESAAAAGSSGAGSSMAGSPLLATLPSYIRRLRRLHLALAAYRRTAVERARWAEAAHQRAVDSCRCGDAAVRNLGRLAASLRAKTRAAADRLRPKADRWTRMAARAPTYWSRLEKIPVSRAMLPGTAGEAVATLADTVPEGAMRGWAEACGSNAVALKGAVDGLLEDVRAFLVGVSKATSQALMRRARQAARQASDVLASAVAGGSTAPGGATASVIMTAITELEATLSEALDEALPALKAEDEKAVAAQGSVAEALGACRKVLLHRLGAVAQRQSDIVSLFTRRGAIEAAGEVLGEQCAELEHLRSLPKAYAAAATEAVRRRAFTHELNSRLRDIGEELGRMRAQEAERRDQFNRRLGQHLPSSLAPWLQERPPHVEIRCFPTATAVPPVTRKEADAIAEAIGGGGSALAGRSSGNAASAASAGDGSPLSEQVSGRGSPTPGDSSPTEAGTDAAARRRSADVASASRALRAAADEEARERMRIVRLEHENASLVAELTALLAVVEVGSDSSSDSSSESAGGSDDEGDGATGLGGERRRKRRKSSAARSAGVSKRAGAAVSSPASSDTDFAMASPDVAPGPPRVASRSAALPSRSPPMCSDGDEDADGDDEASGRLRNAVASPRSGGASAPASAATANDAPRSFQRRFDAAPPGMPDLGSPSAAGSPESAAGAVARGLSGVSGGSAGAGGEPAPAGRGAPDEADAGPRSGGVREHASSSAGKAAKVPAAGRAAVSEGGSGSPVRTVARAGSRGQGALPMRPHGATQRGVADRDATDDASDAAAGASGPDDAVSPPVTLVDDAAGAGAGDADGSSTPPQAVGPVRSPAQRPTQQPHALAVPLLTTRAVSDGESPHRRSPHRSTRRCLQRVYELATLASSGAAKAMGPLSAALEAAQAEAERMAAPAYGSAPDAPGMDLSRAAAAATPLRLKAATRTPPGGPHAARPGAEPRSREAGLQLIREAADMAAKPPTAHRPGGPSGGAGSGLGIAAQGTPSAVAAAAGYAPGRGGQFPLRAAPVLSESEPPTPNRSLHPFQSPEGTDDAADESGGADEASPGAGGGRKQTDPGSAGAASGATARASAPRITAPGPGRLGDWMGAVTGRPSRLPPTSQPLAARQLARARSSAALPGSRTTSSGSSSAGAGAAGGAGQRVAAAYAAVSAAHAVIMASPGRASAAGDSEGFPCRAQEWDGTPASSRVYPETVVNVVRRMAKQLDDAVRVAQSLGKRMGELEQRDQKRVSFLDFRPGDLALFMRAQVRCPATGNPVYVVLHHGCPRFYLSEPAADDARDGDEAWPDLVLVRIESVSARIAGHRGTRDNRVSVEPGATFWEAAGTPLYTMTDGIVRTSPALSAAD